MGRLTGVENAVSGKAVVEEDGDQKKLPIGSVSDFRKFLIVFVPPNLIVASSEKYSEFRGECFDRCLIEVKRMLVPSSDPLM